GFAAFAHLGGVKIREDVAALEIVREGDRVTGVRTSEGLISCDRVLLATGCWTASLAATAHVAVPIWPYARSIMESRPFPTLSRLPMTIELESGFHFRPKGAAQRFAMPNLTSDGRVEKVPSSPPRCSDPLSERPRHALPRRCARGDRPCGHRRRVPRVYDRRVLCRRRRARDRARRRSRAGARAEARRSIALPHRRDRRSSDPR